MRDRMLKGWQFSSGDTDHNQKDFGSGYPSDPKCKAWMETAHDPVFGYGEFIRFSWAPTKQRLLDQGVPVTFRADLDDEDEFQQQKGMSAFLTKPGQSQQQQQHKKKRKRLGYFESQKLQVVTTLN
jgi:ribonuclease H2 subunit A